MSRRLRLAAFLCYAVPLFVATHWPALTVPMKGRWDLLIHMAVFCVWNLLFTSLGAFGRPLSGRNTVMSAMTATAYAGLDEGLQAIPAIRRTPAWDDFAANSLGVWFAAATVYLLSSRWQSSEKKAP